LDGVAAALRARQFRWRGPGGPLDLDVATVVPATSSVVESVVRPDTAIDTDVEATMPSMFGAASRARVDATGATSSR